MRKGLVVLAGIALLAASCGDDDDSDGGGSLPRRAGHRPAPVHRSRSKGR